MKVLGIKFTVKEQLLLCQELHVYNLLQLI